MAAKKMTVAEAVVLLLENFGPFDVVEFDFTTKVTVTPVAPVVAERVNRKIFEVEELEDPADIDEGDLVYFDYTNPGNGPVERVGFVLKADFGKILLEDLSVGGKPRWFDHDFIEDIYLLS